MSFKKTVIISALFHICLFATVLVLSAGISGDSSKIPSEKVLFVRLAEDISKSGNKQYVGKIKKTNPKIIRKIKVKKHPFHDIKNKDVSVKLEATELNTKDLNIQEEPEEVFLPTSYEDGRDEIVNISYGREKAVIISLDSFSSDSRGTSGGNKGAGVLPTEIIEIIRDAIEREKSYPVLARRKGIEGTVIIGFSIGLQGQPQDIKILKSSGSSVLDSETLRIVKRAAPFPHVDSPIEVPVVYRLKN